MALLRNTEKTTEVNILDNKHKEVVLKNVPVYIEEDTGDEVFTFGDILKADQQRIVKKYGIKEYNVFELALLFADVKQRRNAIRQKFRFNKMLFYVQKRLEEEFGKETLIFDKMGSARAGPVPVHLKEDIKDLKARELIEIYLIKDNKKVPGSKDTWEKLKDKLQASIECSLTKKGEKLAKKLWNDLDDYMKRIILNVKIELMYLDTEKLKEKVHKEFPEYKMNYTENDTETFEEFLI